MKTDNIPFIKCLNEPKLEVRVLYLQAIFVIFTEWQRHTGAAQYSVKNSRLGDHI